MDVSPTGVGKGPKYVYSAVELVITASWYDGGAYQRKKENIAFIHITRY